MLPEARMHEHGGFVQPLALEESVATAHRCRGVCYQFRAQSLALCAPACCGRKARAGVCVADKAEMVFGRISCMAMVPVAHMCDRLSVTC